MSTGKEERELQNYFNNLTFAELKRAITQLNKIVREDMIIKVIGKTHEELKTNVRQKWNITKVTDANWQEVPAVMGKTKKIKLSNVTKSLSEMAQKREEAKQERISKKTMTKKEK